MLYGGYADAGVQQRQVRRAGRRRRYRNRSQRHAARRQYDPLRTGDRHVGEPCSGGGRCRTATAVWRPTPTVSTRWNVTRRRASCITARRQAMPSIRRPTITRSSTPRSSIRTSPTATTSCWRRCRPRKQISRWYASPTRSALPRPRSAATSTRRSPTSRLRSTVTRPRVRRSTASRSATSSSTRPTCGAT